ncbi:MAG: cyanophycin synthetase [Syntrophomonas sp.]
MKLLDIKNYSGRNIYSHQPVVKMIIDLENLADITTKSIPDFNEKLMDLFPGLESHHCSLGYEGGFCQRLKEGTFVSHVTEHIAIELQCMLGFDVYFGKTRNLDEPSKYCIVYEYLNEQIGLQCGRDAVEIVSKLANGNEVPIHKILEGLQNLARQTNLGPSTQAIYDEAKKRQIPVKRLGEDSLLQLGYGKYCRLIEASLPGTTGCIAVDLAKNKPLANRLLRDHNIPVPEGDVACSEEEAVAIADQIGYPIVIKPYDGNQGKGVSTHIANKELLRKAYQIANNYSRRVLIEKHIYGKDYRVLVVGDKVSAVAERKPPYIVGDGIHSIGQLVELENQNPQRGEGHEKPLTKIKLDTVAKEWMRRSELDENSIPLAGELVLVRENSNLSTGGQARDVTLDIHPVNKALAIKAAKVIGLEVAGIDLVSDDISQPLIPGNGAIIEVNAVPGLRMHLYPSQGQSRNVAADILDYIYPPGSPTSIPIISVTGSNGKTTVTRLISHVLSLLGRKIGMTCSSGTYIGNECISKGDNTGPISARMVLSNRDVDIAVLETARGGIIKRGLGYELADIGVVVNISEDHLGLDGIHTLQDMAFVKALVVEAIKPEGYAVLNADDPMTAYIENGIKANIIYFSQNVNNSLIQSHIMQGKMAAVVENDSLVCYYQNNRESLLNIKEIPLTCKGKISCNIENSLAAAASLMALGVSEKVIAWGLRTFKPDPLSNAGRFNHFQIGDFQLLLDYGHNLSGYQAVSQFIQGLNAKRLVGVIGMPGDRLDEAIFEVGKLSGRVFSKIYIKEDQDLRGREPGEVASILYHGALTEGISADNIKIIHSEPDALESAILTAMAGDLIVVFYEEFDSVFDLINGYIEQQQTRIILPISEIEAADKWNYVTGNFTH